MNHWDYFKISARKAIERGNNDRRGTLVGCVGLSEGKIIQSKNISSMGTSPSAHAEVRTLKKRGNISVLYVSRIAKKDGNFSLAKPCKNCMTRIRAYRVKKVYYTISNSEYGVICL